MKFSIAYALAVPLLALAACGDKTAGTGGNVTAPAAAPVAAAPAPTGRNWTETVVKTPEGGYRMGNPAAAIKLVEYGSRTCPTCGAFGQTGQKPLTENYVATGKVSYEFRDYLVHGAPDLAPSLLGRCVGTGPFFPLLEQMYMNQPQFEAKLADQAATGALQARLANRPPTFVANAWADYLGYVDFVKQRGVTEQQARACLADGKAIDDLVKMMGDGQGATVTGTPTFFLNGQKVDGITWNEIEAALKQAGA